MSSEVNFWLTMNPNLRSNLRRIPYARVFAAKLRKVRSSVAGEMHGQKIRFSEDGLSTIHNCDFLEDARFKKALAAAEATGSWQGWPMRWRAYIICWAAERAMNLEGDFVECGVNRGGFARMILDYVDFEGSGKKFFLFDTFKGFSPTHLTAGEKSSEYYSYPDCLEDVRKTFASFRSVDIIPGTVPETLSTREIGRVAFLSIDMNCVMPEIAAANHFWGKLVSGAVVLLDDYGFTEHIEQKHAFDLFAKERGVSVLTLPTGQGLMIKP